jgi:hypothetical protein
MSNHLVIVNNIVVRIWPSFISCIKMYMVNVKLHIWVEGVQVVGAEEDMWTSKQQQVKGNCMMRNFCICTSHQIEYGW